MKFSNIKNKTVLLSLITVFFANIAVFKSAHAAEDKQLECGKKVGATLALCLFKLDDNLNFLDYIQQWRKIINEYQAHFDQQTVSSAIKLLDDIELYVKTQYAHGKYVSPNKVAAFLTQLTENLPNNVKKQLDITFEQLQLKLLKRSKPLGTVQLLGPLSNRLNQKRTTQK